MINIAAKFKVDGVEKTANDQRVLSLSACVDQSGDNVNWSKWTPSGHLRMTITNPDLFESLDQLKPGDLYYLNIMPLT